MELPYMMRRVQRVTGGDARDAGGICVSTEINRQNRYYLVVEERMRRSRCRTWSQSTWIQKMRTRREMKGGALDCGERRVGILLGVAVK
jgi:hypothetical protein